MLAIDLPADTDSSENENGSVSGFAFGADVELTEFITFINCFGDAVVSHCGVGATNLGSVEVEVILTGCTDIGIVEILAVCGGSDACAGGSIVIVLDRATVSICEVGCGGVTGGAFGSCLVVDITVGDCYVNTVCSVVVLLGAIIVCT